MQSIDISELAVTHEAVDMDDQALVQLYNQLYTDTKEKKEKFDHKLLNFNENDYLSVAIARLAYVFTKERYETMCEEAKKRGLITEDEEMAYAIRQ